MLHVFRQPYTIPIPEGAQRVTITDKKGRAIPAVRFKRRDGKTVTAPLTKKGDRCRLRSPTYSGRVNGKPVTLCENKEAAEIMLADLIRQAALADRGIVNPFEAHHKRPLAEHLADWEASLLASGATAKHVRQTLASARRVIEGCGFAFIVDLSASRVQQYVAGLRERRRALAPLDPAKQEYTRKELAELLAIKPAALTALVQRRRLAALGNGKARRYPRATAEALYERRIQGRSIKTSNLYLDAVKGFASWLVQDRRMPDNPLGHLCGGNVKLDRRHDRRALPLAELQAILGAAARSHVAFRGLAGPDRRVLYLTACATGFRAEELACLRPESFDLDAVPPVAILGAAETKNRKGATQPLPPDVAAVLRDYIQGRPTGEPLWPGTWWKMGAEMLRVDLEAAGIPYAIDGPDGPLYADFHALRHSYIALLEKSGATLKEAMQLARHSDPKLTMAVYGRAQLHDLGRAVERLPDLLAGPMPEAVAATGTDGNPMPTRNKPGAGGPGSGTGAYSALTAPSASGGGRLRVAESTMGGEPENSIGRKPLEIQEVAAGGESQREREASSPSRTRTYNKPVNSRLLYH
jgi:integrase